MPDKAGKALPPAPNPNPFQQNLKEVKACFAKLQEQIDALEGSFQQELQLQVVTPEAGKPTEKEGKKSTVVAKKPKKKVNMKEKDADDTTAESGSQVEEVIDEVDNSKQEVGREEEAPGEKIELKKSNTAKTVSSAAMDKMKNNHGERVDPHVKAFVEEFQEEEDDGQNTRLQQARIKMEACRRSQNISFQKVGFFLSIAMGKTTHDIVDPHEIRWLMFEFFAAMMIFANSLILGLEVAHLSTNVDPSQGLRIISLLFTNWFILEVIIRMRVSGVKGFFTGEEKVWNCCDLALVLLSIFEMATTSFGSGTSRSPVSTIKAVKIIRVARLFRLFRFFPQLARLAMMVADSVKQLLWALVMFMLIMYTWAVTLTEGCTEWIKESVNATSDVPWDNFETQISLSDPGSPLQKVHHFFGSLDRSIYTLFQVSLGGISWHEVTDAVGHVDALSFILLFAYIIFTILALMNVFTGVFVDKAVQNSKKQRKSQIEEALDKKRTLLDQIVEFFVATDVNGDGTISSKEMYDLLHDPVMSAYFDMIGFRPGDAKLVAELLDQNSSGDICLDEFISGCERMRGEAKGIDIHLLLMECYQIHHKLDSLFDAGSTTFNPHRRLSPLRHRGSHWGAKMQKTLSNL